jgi:hypothetical protein
MWVSQLNLIKNPVVASLAKNKAVALALFFLAIMISSLIIFSILAAKLTPSYSFMIYENPIVAGQYDAQAFNGTICFSSRNQSLIELLVYENLMNGGGTVYLSNLKHIPSVAIPVGVVVTQAYNGSVKQLQSVISYNSKLTNYRNKIINWIMKSGVLTSDNEVYSSVDFYAGGWYVSGWIREDTCFDVAKIFAEQYQTTGNCTFLALSTAIASKAIANSVIIGTYPALPTSDTLGVYIQDNGRGLQDLSYVAISSGDLTLLGNLIAVSNFWVSKINTNGVVDPSHGSFDLLGSNTVRGDSELCIGLIDAYQTTGNDTYLGAATCLGNWMLQQQWLETVSKSGSGNVEVMSNGLRAMCRLYQATNNVTYKIKADTAFQWLKAQCDFTHKKWGIRVPADTLYGLNYQYFNTMYMNTPQAFTLYAEISRNPVALSYAHGILDFVCSTMMLSGNSTIEGGIVGEWNLQTNTASSRIDSDSFMPGQSQYVNWCNTQIISALNLVQNTSITTEILSFET